jgi:hypothetical protein
MPARLDDPARGDLVADSLPSDLSIFGADAFDRELAHALRVRGADSLEVDGDCVVWKSIPMVRIRRAPPVITILR